MKLAGCSLAAGALSNHDLQLALLGKICKSRCLSSLSSLLRLLHLRLLCFLGLCCLHRKFRHLKVSLTVQTSEGVAHYLIE